MKRRPHLAAAELRYLVSGRVMVGLGIAALAVVAWTFTVFNIGPMVGTPALPLDLYALGLFTAAWTVSMVAMMFPTAVPMILTLLNAGRNASAPVKEGGGPSPAKALVFVVTYVGAWVGAGGLFYWAAAVALSVLPVAVNLFIGTTVGIGTALIVVAAYQLSPVKGECLARCHPTSFLFSYYRGGFGGSVRMGLEYAKYCVGCCWVMMVFLLVSASMGLLWMVAFTGVIFLERNFPLKTWLPKAFGVGFLVAGAAFVVL